MENIEDVGSNNQEHQLSDVGETETMDDLTNKEEGVDSVRADVGQEITDAPQIKLSPLHLSPLAIRRHPNLYIEDMVGDALFSDVLWSTLDPENDADGDPIYVSEVDLATVLDGIMSMCDRQAVEFPNMADAYKRVLYGIREFINDLQSPSVELDKLSRRELQKKKRAIQRELLDLYAESEDIKAKYFIDADKDVNPRTVAKDSGVHYAEKLHDAKLRLLLLGDKGYININRRINKLSVDSDEIDELLAIFDDLDDDDPTDEDLTYEPETDTKK